MKALRRWKGRTAGWGASDTRRSKVPSFFLSQTPLYQFPAFSYMAYKILEKPVFVNCSGENETRKVCQCSHKMLTTKVDHVIPKRVVKHVWLGVRWERRMFGVSQTHTPKSTPPPPNVAPTADTWDKLLKGNCFWRVITVGSGVSGPYQEGWFLWTTGDMGHPISSPDELADFTGFSSVLAVYWVTSDVNLVWYPPTRLCYGETRTLLVVSLIWLFVGIRPPAPIGNNLIAANWLTHRRKSIRLMVIAWRRCRGPWSIANRFTWIWSGF